MKGKGISDADHEDLGSRLVIPKKKSLILNFADSFKYLSVKLILKNGDFSLFLWRFRYFIFSSNRNRLLWATVVNFRYRIDQEINENFACRVPSSFSSCCQYFKMAVAIICCRYGELTDIFSMQPLGFIF